MSTMTKSADEFTVIQLKDILQARKLKTSGSKHELINRMMAADPSGDWMTATDLGNNINVCDGLASESLNVAGPAAGSANKSTFSGQDTEQILKEKEWAVREKEWAVREAAGLRREIEMMHENQRLNMVVASTPSATPTPMNQSMSATPKVHSSILSLLGYFEGRGATFETWRKQVSIIKSAHQLDEAATKILVVSRLKGNALEWFHSRADYLEMPVDSLIDELGNAFYDRPTIVEARRAFEARIWKREESFAEYAHEKTILANRISVGEQELVEYLVDGIPDFQLQRNARLQKFDSKAALLDRFRDISLREGLFRVSRPGASGDDAKWRAGSGNVRRGDSEAQYQRGEGFRRRGEGFQQGGEGFRRRGEGFQQGGEGFRRRGEGFQQSGEGFRRSGEGFRRGSEGFRRGGEGFQRRGDWLQRPEAGQNQRRCFNCGGRDHESRDCPMRNRGTRCFECHEYGHMSPQCPKKRDAAKETLAVVQTLRKKYFKKVLIKGREITALIDTGSDICLMRVDEYSKLGAPPLRENDIRFRGVGSGTNRALGEFSTEVVIDGDSYPITVQVVSNSLISHTLLIGTDFLDAVELSIKHGEVLIRKIEKEYETPDIFKLNYEREVNKVDVSHIGNAQHRSALTSVIENYRPNKVRDVGTEMTLVVKDDVPVYQRARRLSPSERDKVNAQIQEWLRDGIVQPSLSEYASPVVMVKKQDGSDRLCVDFRLINRKIVKDRYPLPLIEDQLDLLQNAKVYSTLDLKNGFFHVAVSRDSQKYTAFIVPDGQYEFLKVPFGLCNSPAVFQKYINAAFRELIDKKIVLTYMDDLIVPSIDYESGLSNLEIVLRTASETGLVINWKKCSLLQSEVEFLGHIVKDGTVRPSERKTAAVVRFPKPTTFKQVQSFLGLTGYFRKYIANYSMIARPLTNLLRSDVQFRFGSEEESAFEELKSALVNKPVLRIYRVGAETELHTDASKLGYGAILLQMSNVDNALHPVYFASGKTTPAEEKYASYELEVLAIVKAIKKFRVYLLGIPFKIITDCRAFALTMRKKDLCVRVARWALLLEEYQYVVEHRPGKNMRHVDALSRNPLPMCMLINESDSSMAARLRKAQREDRDLRKISELLETKPVEGYIIRGGLLFKQVDDDIRLVVPKSMQAQIVRRAHEEGHFSVEKTEALLKKDYWFREMRSRVEKVTRNCISCILAERKHGKHEGLLHSIDKGEVPLDTYHVDHLGPLPSTKKLYRYIFVIIDAFTKFIWLYATKTCNAAEVLSKLDKQAVIFGNPRRIISDRGSAFTSSDFSRYCEEQKIQHVLTTTGVPRANGQVERVNRTLIPMLTKLSAPKPAEWHKYLERCQKCLNATVSRSINMSPFKVLFGTDVRSADDPRIMELLEEEWAAVFQQNRDELRERAKEGILKIQQENRRSFNRKRKEARQYTEGDLVAVKRTQQGPGLKFASKFFGPYRIQKVLRNDRYVVERVGDQEGPQCTSTAADYIKPWLENDSDDASEVED